MLALVLPHRDVHLVGHRVEPPGHHPWAARVQVEGLAVPLQGPVDALLAVLAPVIDLHQD